MSADRTRRQKAPPPRSATLRARVVDQVTLEADAAGRIAASFTGQRVDLGPFDAATAARVGELRRGLNLDAASDQAMHGLARRLAAHGLLEYCLGSDDHDEVVIEPQLPDYWPRLAPLDDTGVFALSRFAYLRRRGTEMALESPRAGALFKLCNPKLAAAIAALATPQSIAQLRSREDYAGDGLLALLVDCRIVYAVDPSCDGGFRLAEGDDDLVLWDFHDLLFHARSTQGRHANPAGALYPHVGVMPPPPALRPRWPGKSIDLKKLTAAAASAGADAALPRPRAHRHSTRVFDAEHPITLAELALFLDGTARVQAKWNARVDLDGNGGGPLIEYAARPYPSAGAAWELELYLSVDRCAGLARGFYHYDAGRHALVPITVRATELEAMLKGAKFAMGAPAVPQIVVTIAARFGRISWKYSAIAYALILKDVGVLMQSFYGMAAEMGLGGCAIGTGNIDLFARMTGIEFHIEGPVGQFVVGRSAKSAD